MLSSIESEDIPPPTTATDLLTIIFKVLIFIKQSFTHIKPKPWNFVQILTNGNYTKNYKHPKIMNSAWNWGLGHFSS